MADLAKPAVRPDIVRRGLGVVWQGIRHEPGMFGWSVLGSAVYGAGTAGGGWVLGRVTADILQPAFARGSATGTQVLQAFAALSAVAMFTSVGVVVRRAAAGATMFRLQARYRRAVTRQYLRLPLSWHHAHPTGQLLSNANADVEATWQVFAPLPMALGVLVMLGVAGIVMLAADPVLAGVGLLVVPGLFAANTLYQRRMSPLVVQAQALRAQVSTVAHESFEGATVVKTLGREQAETDRFQRVARTLQEANIAVGRTRGIFDPVIEALPTLGTLAILALGTARVASGATTTADVVQVAYVLTLVGFPVRALGWVLGELPRTVVGWDRVSAVLRAGDGMTYGSASLPASGPAHVSAVGVGYRYAPAPTRAEHPQDDAQNEGQNNEQDDDQRAPALIDVNLQIPPGRTVAIVGPTGSGKSTLAGLLARLVDPTEGVVQLDGVDLREVRTGGVADSVALVPQTAFVFDDTVHGNITLGASVSDDEVWSALRVAQAERFVRALPEGLATQVGERGTTLSGGQRQRIALARAVLRAPRLLVLDDATSAVDPRVEAEILAGLRGSGRPTTVVMVAYRMATIALADDVIFLEGGQVTGHGTHTELLATSPGYERLVMAYAKDAAERAEAQSAAGEPGDQHDQNSLREVV